MLVVQHHIGTHTRTHKHLYARVLECATLYDRFFFLSKCRMYTAVCMLSVQFEFYHKLR